MERTLPKNISRYRRTGLLVRCCLCFKLATPFSHLARKLLNITVDDFHMFYVETVERLYRKSSVGLIKGLELTLGRRKVVQWNLPETVVRKWSCGCVSAPAFPPSHLSPATSCIYLGILVGT